MMRLADWKERLNAELDASRARPMNWADNNCLRFCARCILAMTGEDFVAALQPPEDEADAEAYLASFGGLEGLLTAQLGPAQSPLAARKGDVVLAILEGRPTAGISNGTTCAFVSQYEGLSFASCECIKQSWRVG